MTEFGRGIKSGIAAGIFKIIYYFMFATILAVTIYPNFWSTLPDFLFEFIGSPIIIFAIACTFVGISLGLIFGAIFAGIYEPLVGNTSIKKGIVLSIIYWLFFIALYQWRVFVEFPIVIIPCLTSHLIWGVFLGIFWDRFEQNIQVKQLIN